MGYHQIKLLRQTGNKWLGYPKKVYKSDIQIVFFILTNYNIY